MRTALDIVVAEKNAALAAKDAAVAEKAHAVAEKNAAVAAKDAAVAEKDAAVVQRGIQAAGLIRRRKWELAKGKEFEKSMKHVLVRIESLLSAECVYVFFALAQTAGTGGVQP